MSGVGDKDCTRGSRQPGARVLGARYMPGHKAVGPAVKAGLACMRPGVFFCDWALLGLKGVWQFWASTGLGQSGSKS